MTERIVIVGGPRRGKSTLAQEIVNSVFSHPAPWVIHHRCGDPLSKVKDPLPQVEYLPEKIPFAGDEGAAQWVTDNWFPMPGPWVLEGHVMARALLRWLDGKRGDDPDYPCDRIFVLDRPGFGMPSPRQNSMHKGVMTTWSKIADYFEPITEYR